MRSIQKYSELTKPLSVFLSYTHADQKLRDSLVTSLKLFERLGAIKIWHDGCIDPGETWEPAIWKNLREADVILLLVSPDFVASDYCWNHEMHFAMERHNCGDAVVIPILLRPLYDWEEAPFAILQLLPSDRRPVTEWESLDKAFENVAGGIETVLIKWAEGWKPPNFRRVTWSVKYEGKLEQVTEERIDFLTRSLRKMAQDLSIRFVSKHAGSIELTFQSSEEAFDTLHKLDQDGVLDTGLGEKILELKKQLGAHIRVESREVEPGEPISPSPLQQILVDDPSRIPFPPIVGGMVVPGDNPLSMGFNLYVDDKFPAPSSEEVMTLQTRLGRYMTTFAVVKGENLHVDLSPFESYCGLPLPLRNTELGRDMLAEDFQLKLRTSRLLHPETESGRAFWKAVEGKAGLPERLETCVRVWAMPDKVTLEEKFEDGCFHVILQEMRMKVLCESDYGALKQAQAKLAPHDESLDCAVIDAFKQHILSPLQEAVLRGPGFGVLRQIFSVMIMSNWFTKKLGDHLSGFVGNNDTARYKLNTVGDEVFEQIQREYLEVFKDGLWKWVRPIQGASGNLVRKRIYVVGGITLGSSGIRSCEPSQT